MGSRRGRHAALIGAAFVGACTVAPSASAPSPVGERWAFPLVGPLEDGLLVAAVYVNGHGPLAFAIDLDARHSSIDESLARALQAEAKVPHTEDDAVGLPHVVHGAEIIDGPAAIDALGQSHPTRQTDVTELRIGDFVVHDHTVLVVRDGAFDSEGRRIWGRLGHDVFDPKLAFGFDRELGIGMLARTRGFTPPGEVTPVKTISRYDNEDQPLSRHIVDVALDGLPAHLAVDLGHTSSALRAALWPKAKLASVPVTTRELDELGDQRIRASAAIAAKLDARGLHAQTVLVTDYDDRRWHEQDLDGSLGLAALREYSVWVSWDQHGIFVTPRRDRVQTLTARLRRWADGKLLTCPHPGCVTITLTPPAAPPSPAETAAPPDGGPVPPANPADATMPAPTPKHGSVRIARDDVPAAKGFDLDVTFEVGAADGTRQLYAASLSAAATAIDGELDATEVELLDVGPLPRACPNHLACIRPIQRPR